MAKTQAVNLGFGHLGNGITVWDRTKEVNNDYKKIAHIRSDGEVKFYTKHITDDAKDSIITHAEKSL